MFAEKLEKRSNEPGASRFDKSKDDQNVSYHFYRIKYRQDDQRESSKTNTE